MYFCHLRDELQLNMGPLLLCFWLSHPESATDKNLLRFLQPYFHYIVLYYISLLHYIFRSERLNLTDTDIRSLKDSNITYAIFNSLQNITNATSHNSVAQELGILTAYSLLCKLDNNQTTLSNITWYTYLQR